MTGAGKECELPIPPIIDLALGSQPGWTGQGVVVFTLLKHQKRLVLTRIFKDLPV